MIKIDDISQCKLEGKTFAEFIATILKDEVIEIYLGDSYEDISTDQITISYPAVFCGKVIAAYKECLIIKCHGKDISGEMSFCKTVFINERAIRALSPSDNNLMKNLFLDSGTSSKLKGYCKW